MEPFCFSPSENCLISHISLSKGEERRDHLKEFERRRRFLSPEAVVMIALLESRGRRAGPSKARLSAERFEEVKKAYDVHMDFIRFICRSGRQSSESHRRRRLLVA